MARSANPGLRAVLATTTILLASPTAALATGPAEVTAAVDAAIAAKGLGSTNSPGCAISVSRGADVLLRKGYGTADIEHGAPFGPQTVSENGSVAKQFTAAAILILAEEGRLSLDDDIRKFLPEMPDYGTPIRIYDLIHQTSGIREWSTLTALRGYPRFYKKIHGMDDVFALLSAQRTLNFKPGQRYEYSNSNYALLSFIAERVSGMSAAEFGRIRIFQPLGMTSTQWRDDLRRIVPNRAVAYRAKGDGWELGMPFENVYGHGAMLTTVDDLQRWNQALTGGGLSPYVTRQMLSPGKLSDGSERAYGGGVALGQYRGHAVHRHGGVTAGYTAQLWAFPKSKISIALLCNARVGEADITMRAADAALGLPATPMSPQPEAGWTPESPPALFRSADGEMLAVASDEGRMQVNLFTKNGYMPITATGAPGRFIAISPFGPAELHFLDSDRIVLNLDSREPIAFSRTAASGPSAVALAGRYVSRDLGAAYDLTLGAGRPRLDLADPSADDPLGFDLEWLTGDTYVARVDSRSGYIRDDMVVTFTAENGGATRMTLSSVAGLQAVDGLVFTRSADISR